MNEVKDILDRTLPANEPPMVVDADDLLGRGRRRKRNRRAVFAAGGGAAAVAGIAAIALLLQGGTAPGPGPAASPDAVPTTSADPVDPPPDDAVEPETNDAFDEHSTYLRSAFTDGYPDLVFEAGPTVGPDLFEFGRFDPNRPWYASANVVSSDDSPMGMVFVTAYLPDTDWTTEPAEFSKTGPFSVAPPHIYSCYSSDDELPDHNVEYPDGYVMATDCVDETGPDGEEVVIITQTEGMDGAFQNIITAVVVFRPDGTALTGQFTCLSSDEDEESSADSCSLDTIPATAIRDIVIGMPTLPQVAD